METTVTKIRENREKCIELQQKMKKSPLSIYEEIIKEHFVNYTNDQSSNSYNEFSLTVKEVNTKENNESSDVKIDKNKCDKNTMDYLLNIELKINNIKKDLYCNFDKYSRKENNELIKELNYFKTLYNELIDGNYVIVKF